MLIIPVFDLLGGKAVHAIAGNRSEYQSLQSQFGSGEQPRDLIEQTIVRSECKTIYVADLDAIQNHKGQSQKLQCQNHQSFDLIELAVEFGAQVWIDAGFENSKRSFQILETLTCKFGEVVRPIFATETFENLDDLQRGVMNCPGSIKPICSLDLMHKKVFSKYDGWKDVELDFAYSQLGLLTDTTIVLELGLVGTEKGVDVELVKRLSDLETGSQLIWGGGVRDSQDVHMLETAGAQGALVGTAFHQGKVKIAKT